MEKLSLEEQLIKIKRRQSELLEEILRYSETLRDRKFKDVSVYIERVLSVSCISFIDSYESEPIYLDYFLVRDVASKLFESKIKNYYSEYHENKKPLE